MKTLTLGLSLALAFMACDDSAAGSGKGEETDAFVQLCPGGGTPVAETCDRIDNDCDGRMDEGFDTRTDPDNCGACGVSCEFGNAEGACRAGECVLTGCPPGSADLDRDPTNGCEHACEANDQPEICDEVDNDCDGRTDEGFDLQFDLNHCGGCGVACSFPRAQALCDRGACVLARCEAGFGDQDGDPSNGCEAECEPDNPGVEVCDEEDNDCDGIIDEGFDADVDPENCGGCGVRCAFANAAARCADATCEIAGCDEGFVDADGLADNGCEALCEPSNEGVEVCDAVDNDCNGTIDDGFDLEGDLENCGACGEVCRPPNADPTCDAGRCAIDICTPGFADVDGDAANGCERACERSNDGVEACDELDNDCDGATDEDFDTRRDVAHCGGCGQICETGNAEPECRNGVCAVGRCPEGFVDADEDPENGCELECTPTEDAAEICDGLDNNCNGAVDEGFDLRSDLAHCGACNAACDPENSVGVCNDGVCDTTGCTPGFVDANGDAEDGCELECEPSPDGFEVCDEADNDCDGRSDEGFDLQRDPTHCGACGTTCEFPNGAVACEAGECVRGDCRAGWVDANGEAEDGCEYACTPSALGVELCNGRDDDCDREVDEGFDLGSLDHCGVCNAACRFEHATTECQEGRCVLTACDEGFADVDRRIVNGCESECVPQNEGVELCNEVDEDCDGETDEGFDLERDANNCGACGETCSAERADTFCNGGACRIRDCEAGWVDEDEDFDNGCECEVQNGGVELCNGVDDDCNGVIDDPERLLPPADFECLSRGVCAGVQPTCAGDEWVCPYPETYQQVEDRCDGRDNDCDGEPDEAALFGGLGAPCAEGLGRCRVAGRVECTEAGDGVACTASADEGRSTDEACNDVDDDCDGETDEGSNDLVAVAAGDGVGAFSIFRYEASRPDATEDDSGRSFTGACSKAEALPWVDVDYDAAEAACVSVGMALCSAAQWQRACEGDANQTYPYGNNYRANRCNGFDRGEGETLPSGALANCRRAWAGEAVYDQSGNVWEWTTGAPDGQNGARVIRGGSFGNPFGGLTCQFENFAPEAAARGNLGFRCCTP